VKRGRVRGKHYTIRTVGKNIKWGRGEGDGNFEEENQDFKKWRWERISSCRKLLTTL